MEQDKISPYKIKILRELTNFEVSLTEKDEALQKFTHKEIKELHQKGFRRRFLVCTLFFVMGFCLSMAGITAPEPLHTIFINMGCALFATTLTYTLFEQTLKQIQRDENFSIETVRAFQEQILLNRKMLNLCGELRQNIKDMTQEEATIKLVEVQNLARKMAAQGEQTAIESELRIKLFNEQL